jgi:hypothetical protein
MQKDASATCTVNAIHANCPLSRHPTILLLVTRVCLALSFLLCALDLASTRAQSIHGFIRDSATSRPIAGVRVVLVRPPNTTLAVVETDSSGVYALIANVAAQVRLELQRIGYSPRSAPIDLTSGQSIRLDLTLSPAPIPLEPIAATATPVQAWNLERFMERQRTGGGRYLGPEQIAWLAPRSAIQAVLRTRDGRFLADGRGNGLLMRGDRNIYCIPRVFIDGTEAPKSLAAERQPRGSRAIGFNVEALIPVSAIRGVEVYSRLSDAPVEYRRGFGMESVCGIVLFWTDRALGVR